MTTWMPDNASARHSEVYDVALDLEEIFSTHDVVLVTYGNALRTHYSGKASPSNPFKRVKWHRVLEHYFSSY